MNPLLRFDGISKSFHGVPVLRDVRFEVGPGRVVGLVGENGAGKSTLMNILGGNLAPDAGEMVLGGAPYSPRTPAGARVAGIGFVHQELNLFPNLTIAENLFLQGFPTGAGLIHRRRTNAAASELLARVGLARSPSTPVGELATGERQLVELARALSFDARLIILDEPTTSLGESDRERLHGLVDRLRSEGRSIVYISHALGDVLRVCDDVAVLRDGGVVGSGPSSGFTRERLISLMVGRDLKQLFPTRGPTTSAAANPAATPALEARGVTRRGFVSDVSFKLARGEVLGVFGLMGAGRTEMARVLFGLDPMDSGSVLLDGELLGGGPRRRIERGLALLTESRRDDGLCLEASVGDNIALATLEKHARTPALWLDVAGLKHAIAGIRDAVRLQAVLPDTRSTKTLSGGNQQKVVLAKWLLASPRALILDEPTRGIDVGARFEIHQLIHALADRGAGVLAISSDLEELVGICDRILVMSRGRITGAFERGAFDREQLLRCALPS